MAWFLKSLALAAVAGGGWYAMQVVEGDRLVVERLMRRADSAARGSDVLAGGEQKNAERLAAGMSEIEPRAFAIRSGGGGSEAARGHRLDRFAEGHARIAQGAGAGAAGPARSDAPPVGIPPVSVQNAPGVPERKAVADETRRRLASAIQAELKRVGCYKGEVDGEWGAASQRAMKEFNQRVRATLPIEQPDYILLTLLQGHTAIACGAVCPRGEAQAADGACQPRSVVAQGRLRSVPAEPAPWAQSLSQLAPANSGLSASAPKATSEADAQRARIAAEQERQLLNREAEGRLQESARKAAEARAKTETEALARRKAEADRARAEAETARAEAEALATRKAEADRALAEAERSRIAAAEERKRQRAAEAEARAEADRLARLADAEKARVAAEARRREELDALAARTPEPPKPAPATVAAPVAEPGLAQPPRKDPDATAKVAVKRARDGDNGNASGNGRNGRSSDAPRFVARFVPPPTYRVGRLPPPPAFRPPPSRPATVRVFAPPSQRTRAVFGYLQRHSP